MSGQGPVRTMVITDGSEAVEMINEVIRESDNGRARIVAIPIPNDQKVDAAYLESLRQKAMEMAAELNSRDVQN
ncbi:hypothetical protein O9K51_03764 [Purpureocillium lavendulum]|uniref:Uncharacterized protein n=1 Tax=Purpureocillium lavendulum TaxID=1247861 RepID=A0AB34FU06_9HYPO|nr:hypothetical protein O9K51_03764 [Purpureocillium lavendulum]